MRFTTAWASVLAQNLSLRAAVAVLGGCTLFFSISTIRLSLKEPIIIERECFSRALKSSDTKHTKSEVEAFLSVALSKRFDTDAADSSVFVDDEELSFRKREQDELAKKGMTQRVLVTAAQIEGESANVEADRILSVGKVRSILAFPLKVTLSSRDRTSANPYGLVIRRVSPVKTEETSK